MLPVQVSCLVSDVADLAKRATYPPSSYRCPGRLPEDKNVSARLATLQHTVSQKKRLTVRDERTGQISFHKYLKGVLDVPVH